MGTVILICGKICSGKSSYAARLRAENGGILLSVDEIMLAVFGQYAGEKHDEYAARVRAYLLDKAMELAKHGYVVILDWGFWRRSDRTETREFFQKHGIACQLHVLDVSEEEWRERIVRRNRAVEAGETQAYFIDDALAAKFASLYEPPTAEESDVLVQ